MSDEEVIVEIKIDSFLAGVQRWDMNKPRIKGGRVYALSENSGTNDTIIGLERVLPSIPYELFDRIKGGVPAFYELNLEAVQGSRGRDTERLLSVENRRQDPALINGLFKPVSGKTQPDSYYQSQVGKITGLAVSASYYDMEDQSDPDRRVQGASVVFMQRSTNTRGDFAGFELFEIKIDFDLFEQLRQIPLPGEYRFDCVLSRRAGHKPALVLKGISSDNTLTEDRLNNFLGITKPAPVMPRFGDSKPAEAKPNV